MGAARATVDHNQGRAAGGQRTVDPDVDPPARDRDHALQRGRGEGGRTARPGRGGRGAQPSGKATLQKAPAVKVGHGFLQGLRARIRAREL
jgi:hypothetical protein